jgi:hypothetical protein
MLLSLVFVGCSGSNGTSTGNPLVSLKFAAFNSSLAVKNASEDVSAMTVSSLKMCFKRLRFKMSSETTNPDPSLDSDNLDFYLGDVTISSLGTTLSSLNVPAGTYERIEFDLSDDCPSGKSVQVTNSNGTFSTDSKMTIKFEGNFVNTGTSDLTMQIQAIVSALNTVTNSSQIKNKAEGVSGTF